MEKTCENCGNRAQIRANYCDMCGTKFIKVINDTSFGGSKCSTKQKRSATKQRRSATKKK